MQRYKIKIIVMFTYRLIMFKMSEITDFNHFPTHFEHPP
ncbi:hypothetical protein SAMN05216463_11173 [Xylanibacter ruminicola]|uniref:Uncharacterized protein n=1 Tax=Xylanibacter ruminicola TaxID=839 RepID=A0A1M6V1Q2_XYLRU|nr:hypothetical protein SAMN05216463_11173 [Xylanibacter ruminicola]